MASPSTADLSGLFMEVYADSLKDLMPSSLTLVPRISFETREKVGNKFHQPVVVASEQGVTYAPTGAGAFNLQNPVALLTKDAQVDAVNMVIAAAVDYESAARAAVSKASFAELTGLKVKHMTSSARKRLEISLWHGQNGLGLAESTTNQSATQTRITISAATWAPLVWAGMTGAMLDYFNNTTKVNTNAVLSIAKVDIANRYVFVNGNSADITAIDAVVENGDEKLFFSTTWDGAAHADMQGIISQLSTVGMVLGIDNTLYEQWMPNVYDCASAALTYAKAEAAVGYAVARGLEEDVEVFMSFATFQNVANDMAALRIIDQSYDPKKAIAGHESVEFYGLNGRIKLTPSGFCPQGNALVLPVKDCFRVGATDLTFATPGSKGGEIFFQMQSQAGFGLRAYQHQGVALTAPSRAVLLKNITNS